MEDGRRGGGRSMAKGKGGWKNGKMEDEKEKMKENTKKKTELTEIKKRKAKKMRWRRRRRKKTSLHAPYGTQGGRIYVRRRVDPLWDPD